jgi:ABC-2 type transport system ATP-binding protein
MSDDIAIKVENLSKTFRLPHEKNNSIKSAVINFYRQNRTYEKQQALKDVSFEIKKGEFFGIVGRNGSGKSTLLKVLAGIYEPSRGEVRINGKLTPFIELGVGFNPELTGRENVFLNGALLGFSRREMQKLYEEIVEFAELERFMDQKLKNYSSGMQVRLAFSIAIRAKTDVLLLDEVLAVGDYDFQQKCFEYFKHLKKIKTTVILVSHDMNNIKQFCTGGIHIKEGVIVAEGQVKDIVDSYNQENIERAEQSSEKQTHHNVVAHGTGEVVIEKVYTEGADGKKKDVFAPNEKIVACFKIKSKRSIATPVYGVVFSDNAGKVVFASNTLDRSIVNPNLRTGEAAIIKYEINNDYDDGTYLISGAVASKDRSTTYARVETAHSFKSVGRNVTARSPYYPEYKIIVKAEK